MKQDSNKGGNSADYNDYVEIGSKVNKYAGSDTSYWSVVTDKS